MANHQISNPTQNRAPKGQKCAHCKAYFVPRKASGGSPQRFCCVEHRKAYHEFGNLPFSKLLDRLRKEMTVLLRDQSTVTAHFVRAELAALQEKLEVLKDQQDELVSDCSNLALRVWKLEGDRTTIKQ